MILANDHYMNRIIWSPMSQLRCFVCLLNLYLVFCMWMQAMKISSIICMAGWLAVYLSSVCIFAIFFNLAFTNLWMNIFSLMFLNHLIFFFSFWQGSLLLDFGRFLTGYGIGILSYVVCFYCSFNIFTLIIYELYAFQK